MEIRNFEPGLNRTPDARSGPPKSGDSIQKESYQKSGDGDPNVQKMEKLAKFKTKDVGEALFSKKRKAVEKLEDQVIKEHSLWHYEKPGHTSCSTVYDKKNGAIYTGIGSLDKWYMTALNTDGTVKWTYPDEPAKSPPVQGKDGTIYFRTHDNLVAMSPGGKVLWKHKTDSHWTDSSPALGPDGSAYIVTGSGTYASHREENQSLVAIKNGKEQWRFNFEGDYTGDPQPLVGKDGTIYLGAEKKVRKGFIFGEKKDTPFLFAIKPDGTEKFRTKVKYWPSYITTQLTEGPDGTIFACHGDKELTAFNPDNGKVRWSYHLEDKVKVDHSGARARLNQVPEFDEDGNVYLASDISSCYPEGYLIKLDKFGNEKWSKSIKGGYSTKPHFGPDGNLWAGTGRGNLLSYDKSGDFKGSYRVGEMYGNNFSFGDDGEIFLNTTKRIIAFQPDMDKIPTETEKAMAGIDKTSESEEITEEPGIKVEDEFVTIGGVKLRKGRKKEAL